MGDIDTGWKEWSGEEERERETEGQTEREREKHLCSQVVAGGQVLEAEQAIPLAGTSSTGIVVHHL